MPSVKPTEDIQPLTAFRANVASFVEQVRRTGRPIVLIQHGRSAAVLLSAADYEALIEELEVLRDSYVSERELAEGKGVPHEEVARELRELLRSRLAK
jgi:prevent-host-death family protein